MVPAVVAYAVQTEGRMSKMQRKAEERKRGILGRAAQFDYIGEQNCTQEGKLTVPLVDTSDDCEDECCNYDGTSSVTAENSGTIPAPVDGLPNAANIGSPEQTIAGISRKPLAKVATNALTPRCPFCLSVKLEPITVDNPWGRKWVCRDCCSAFREPTTKGKMA